MNKELLFLYLLFIGLSVVGQQKNEDLQETNGGVYYGGTFKYNEDEFLKSLNPLNITEVTGHRIAEQIYDGLVAFDQENLTVKPSLAHKWEIENEGTLFTFHLREGVKFHDDECFQDGLGRTVTAQDFKYCFDRLCFYNPSENQGFWIFKDLVVGANTYNYSSRILDLIIPPIERLTGRSLKNAIIDQYGLESAKGVTGIKVLDDYTLQIQLERPFSIFLSRLAMSFTKVYPKEAVEKYGTDMRVKAVGTGPFKLKLLREEEVVFLEKNSNYWGKDEFGNQLPYLNNIKVSFIKEKKTAFNLFTKGDLDMVYKLPFEMKEAIIDVNGQLKEEYSKFVLQSKPSMTIQYYGFLNQGEIFKDKRVRQAFCYAIDREKIIDFTVKGMGFPAIYGFVPPGTGSYDATKIKGYNFNPQKARALMTEAGFSNGEGFPKMTLQLNSGGGRNEQVAEAIQKMLEEHLNIEIELLMVPWAQHIEAIEAAKVDFWRLGWIADYPDAENFLNLFHGKWVPENLAVKTYINSFRYQNEEFDKYLDEALKSTSEAERNKFYLLADQIAINDAPVMPIYYDKDYRLLQPYVKDFFQNGMEYRNLRAVYFVPN